MTDAPKKPLEKIERIVNEIYEYMHTPVLATENPVDRFKLYIRHNKFYFSQHIRNAAASWRLFSALDRVRDITFTLESFELKTKPEKPACTEDYMQACRAHSLPFLSERLIYSLLNFLAYFFDLECRDEKLDAFALTNYINLFDEKLAYKLLSFIKSEPVQFTHGTFAETYYDFSGLPKVTIHTKKDENFNSQVKAIRPYPVDDVVRNANALLEATIKLLENLRDELREKFPSGAYESLNDCVLQVPDPNFPFKDAKMVSAPKALHPIKLYNLITESNHAFWLPLEIDTFILKRNATYADQESEFHKSGTTETIVWEVGGKNSGVTREVVSPREGRHAWTHTILPKSAFAEKGRMLRNSGYAEDVCLLLSLISGRGVYTSETVLRYSHKARIGESVEGSEANKALYDGLIHLAASTDEHADFAGSVLARYREVMQPMSHNNRLVRLFEILEMVSDHYCTDQLKPLPSGYSDYEALRNAIRTELREAERRTGIKFIDGFTPILTHKSTSQKVRDCLNKIGFISALNLEGKESQLHKVIGLTHGIRSTITHSNNMDYEGDKSWVEYYQFLEQTVFIVLLLIIGVRPERTLASRKKDIHGFLDDESYYSKLSEYHEQKMKELEDFLTGKKKPDANGKISFKF